MDRLPADYRAARAAAPSSLSAAPGPLVLSRPAKRLVGLTLSLGIIAPCALFFALFALATTAGPGPSTAPPAASAVSPGASVPASPSTAPAPPTRTERWVTGLRSMRTDMYNAMGSGASTTVPPASLRSAARKFSRCPAALAALGPPPAPLRHEYRHASQPGSHFNPAAPPHAAAP